MYNIKATIRSKENNPEEINWYTKLPSASDLILAFLGLLHS